MSTYEPGTVAMLKDRGGSEEIGFCIKAGRVGGDIDGQAHWRIASGEAWSSVTDVRPLVVLDFDAAELSPTVAVREIREVLARDSLGWPKIADQIEQQTRPPKPPEPTGLGAVVEDAEGVRWVRHCIATCPEGDDCDAWAHESDDDSRAYDVIDVVTVLSEGVKP